MNSAEAENMLLKWARANARITEQGADLLKAAKETLVRHPVQIARYFPAPLDHLYVAVTALGFELRIGDDFVRGTTLAEVVERAAPEVSKRLDAGHRKIEQIQRILDALK